MSNETLTKDLVNYVSDFLWTDEWINWSLTNKQLYKYFQIQLIYDKIYQRKNYFKLFKYWKKYFDVYCFYTYNNNIDNNTIDNYNYNYNNTLDNSNSNNNYFCGITFSYGRYQNFNKKDLKQWLHFFIHFNYPNSKFFSFLFSSSSSSSSITTINNNNNKNILLNPIRVLNMDYNKHEFNKDAIQWLGYLLQFSSSMSYLQVLQLHDCNLTDESMEVLCNSLSARKETSSLQQMYFSSNEITNTSMVYYLDKNRVQNKLLKLNLLDLSNTLVNDDTCRMIYQWYINDHHNHTNNNNNNNAITTDTTTTTTTTNIQPLDQNINQIEYIYLRECSLITETGIELLNRIKSIIISSNNCHTTATTTTFHQKIPTFYLHNSGCQEFEQEWFTNPFLVFT